MGGRKGDSAPAVPDGRVVYAIGDIHGEIGKLDRLHAAIRADAEARGTDRKVTVYVGDYVDRGPDSAGVIDRLVADSLPGFERIFLMGNHEEFLLQFLSDPDTWGGWLMNGGEATLASYDVDLPSIGSFSEDASRLRNEFTARLPDAHRRFLEELRLYHIEGDYLFVHAGIRPGQPIERQSWMDLLWIRDLFLRSDADHGFVVVHGHTPVEQPEIRPNRIDIDTGAVFGGKLTALVLEGAERRFIQA